MINNEGCAQFCEGCPVRGTAEGSLGWDVKEQYYVLTSMGISRPHTERQIRLVGENGGFSKTIDSRHTNYTMRADAEQLTDYIANCGEPTIFNREEVTGFWRRKSTVDVVSCNGLAAYISRGD